MEAQQLPPGNLRAHTSQLTRICASAHPALRTDGRELQVSHALAVKATRLPKPGACCCNYQKHGTEIKLYISIYIYTHTARWRGSILQNDTERPALAAVGGFPKAAASVLCICFCSPPLVSAHPTLFINQSPREGRAPLVRSQTLAT